MLTALLLAGILLYLLWQWLNGEPHPFDKLPGPPKIPFFGNAISYIGVNQRDMFVLMRQFRKEYGDRFVVKLLHRRILGINSPRDTEALLSHSRNISKSKPYRFLQPWLGTGLLLSTGSKWHHRRKILTPSFHYNILSNFSNIIEEKTQELVSELRRRGAGEVDLMPVVSDFTLKTICETAMGTKLDDERSAATVEYKTAVQGIGGMLLGRMTKFWLASDVIFQWSALGRQFERAVQKVHSFADNVILEKKRNRTKADSQQLTSALEGDDLGSKRRLAMMDLLLEAESKGEIDLEGIREEVNTFMFEGHDTTAMALTFGLMLLADHDDIQEKIYEECQSVLGISDRTPNMMDLAEMKYLEAVIKETLRLYPSVPFVGRIVTEDFMMGDMLIKKGSEIAIHIYDLHRREDSWPDPETFKPERFLGAGQRHPYAYVPFSAGPRNCIGQRFAMLEMKWALAEICRAFRIAPVTKEARPTLVADMVLRPIDPIMVKFIER